MSELSYALYRLEQEYNNPEYLKSKDGEWVMTIKQALVDCHQNTTLTQQVESLYQNSKGQTETFNSLMKKYKELEVKCDRHEEGIKHIYTHMHAYNLEHVEAMLLQLLNTGLSIKEIKQALYNEQENK